MDPLTIAASSAKIASSAWKVGEGLYHFFHDVKVIDQTVSGLIAEIKALSGACTLVDERLRDIVQNFDEEATDPKCESRSRLWACVDAQVADSGKSVKQLEAAIAGLVKDGSNPFAQAWRQVKLNMQAKDIGEARNRIRSHTASLQTILQTVAIEICYLAPQRADQQLRTLLSRTEECMEQLRALRLERAEGHTLVQTHENDVLELSGSLPGLDSWSGARGVNISEWMQDIRAIDAIVSRSNTIASQNGREARSVASVPHNNIGIIQEAGSVADNTAPVIVESKTIEDDVSEDDIIDELATEALATGRSHFDASDYKEASSYLRETLKIVRELPTKRQKVYDTWELRFMLSVCAYHTLDSGEAEGILTSVIDSSTQLGERTDWQLLQVCEAGHLLSQVCVKLNKLEQARLYCGNALQGRRRLLGKSNAEYYQSVALMARICELQGNDYRAKIYMGTIPDSEQEALRNTYNELTPAAKQTSLSETIEPQTKPGSIRNEDETNRVLTNSHKESQQLPATSTKQGKRSIYNPARWVGLGKKSSGTEPLINQGTRREPYFPASLRPETRTPSERGSLSTSDTVSLSSRLSSRSTSTLQAQQETESMSSVSDLPLTQYDTHHRRSTGQGESMSGRLFGRRSSASPVASQPMAGIYSRMDTDTTDASSVMTSMTKRDRKYLESKAQTAGYMRMSQKIIDDIRAGEYDRAEVDRLLAERAKAIRNSSLTAVVVADAHEAMKGPDQRDASLVLLNTNFGQITVALRNDMDKLDQARQDLILKASA
ncbi:hypothetical protein HII31_12835 [Pseudocercospora fuligena]|uniref:Fungal N-terminal domain-containing protein n=1 Tax=Pseudocercospora fuligena TaxID=685502 RepID=A0A8H6R8W6_9PEZI|nr:hypothetical protein HII31_12835 [Pseudocercospora fuligena]